MNKFEKGNNEEIAIKKINVELAQKICRELTNSLPEWFGIPEANERYVQGIKDRISFAANKNELPIGLLTLEVPFSNNANIYWMAVKKNYQGQGIGAMLVTAAENYCLSHGIYSLTVETLSQKQHDKNYLKTYKFYEKLGFKPLFELHTYGSENLMVYMQKILN